MARKKRETTRCTPKPESTRACERRCTPCTTAWQPASRYVDPKKAKLEKGVTYANGTTFEFVQNRSERRLHAAIARSPRKRRAAIADGKIRLNTTGMAG